MDEIHEECGIFGIACNSTQDVVNTTYYGLALLQTDGARGRGVHARRAGVAGHG